LKFWNTIPTSWRTSSIRFDVVGQLDSIDHDRSVLMLLKPIDAPD
jgi:hypothetical protein